MLDHHQEINYLSQKLESLFRKREPRWMAIPTELLHKIAISSRETSKQNVQSNLVHPQEPIITPRFKYCALFSHTLAICCRTSGKMKYCINNKADHLGFPTRWCWWEIFKSQRHLRTLGNYSEYSTFVQDWLDFVCFSLVLFSMPSECDGDNKY